MRALVALPLAVPFGAIARSTVELGITTLKEATLEGCSQSCRIRPEALLVDRRGNCRELRPEPR